MKDCLEFEGGIFSWIEKGINPRTKWEKWRTSIWEICGTGEVTPLGGDSKISEEDPPL